VVERINNADDVSQSRWYWVVLALALLAGCAVTARLAYAQTAGSSGASTQPSYKLVQYDEDYRYLEDHNRRTDFMDLAKYLPLDNNRNWYVSLGGEIRERYEYYANANWALDRQDPNGYLLQRYLISGDLHYRETFRVFGQLMSARENGRIDGPRPNDEDFGDLHQGFVDAKLDLNGKGSLVTRVGRQEMFYGSQRLVSLREPPNIRLSFDGVRFVYQNESLNVSGFATKPVKTKSGYFDDRSNPDTTFWGVYGSAPLTILPSGNVDFYYFGFENDNAIYNLRTDRELRHSVGTRIWGKKSDWDYNFELVYQFGKFGEENIGAWTMASDTGYTFAGKPLSPRLFIKADIASGDRNRNDSKLQTFNAMFPRGGYFSETGLIGQANIVDVHPGIELKLTRRVSFVGDWDFFWRESTDDGIYNNALKLVRSDNRSYARYIGSQVQAMLQWSIDRHFTASAVYAHFFAGDFLKETPPGNDVNYFSAWVTYRF
jgi:Alginate export